MNNPKRCSHKEFLSFLSGFLMLAVPLSLHCLRLSADSKVVYTPSTGNKLNPQRSFREYVKIKQSLPNIIIILNRYK
jgi:hypothetical protein